MVVPAHDVPDALCAAGAAGAVRVQGDAALGRCCGPPDQCGGGTSACEVLRGGLDWRVGARTGDPRRASHAAARAAASPAAASARGARAAPCLRLSRHRCHDGGCAWCSPATHVWHPVGACCRDGPACHAGGSWHAARSAARRSRRAAAERARRHQATARRRHGHAPRPLWPWHHRLRARPHHARAAVWCHPASRVAAGACKRARACCSLASRCRSARFTGPSRRSRVQWRMAAAGPRCASTG